jgi:hypothetical protein
MKNETSSNLPSPFEVTQRQRLDNKLKGKVLHSNDDQIASFKAGL